MFFAKNGYTSKWKGKIESSMVASRIFVHNIVIA